MYPDSLATIQPFEPYRYSPKAGDPANLVTQPYDKISPEMQTRYLAASPYNLVRVLLGEKRPTDTDSDNVYTRAAAYLDNWIRDGILARDPAPGIYTYFQEFAVPDSGQRLTRKGFIALGKIEDYSANIVFRHEQTLTGPKKDRLDLLRHTRAHFGQIFMLYPDPQGEIDQLLDQSASAAPVLDVLDDDHARHCLWPITDPSRISQIQALMADKKLLIADGHHRYETALAYRNENPDNPAAKFVMMTLVNMYSPAFASWPRIACSAISPISIRSTSLNAPSKPAGPSRRRPAWTRSSAACPTAIRNTCRSAWSPKAKSA